MPLFPFTAAPLSTFVLGTTVSPTRTLNSYAVIPEMTITATMLGVPTLVLFMGDFNLQSNDNWDMSIFQDAVEINSKFQRTSNFFGGSLLGLTPAQVNAGQYTCWAMLTPTAASHTFDVRWRTNGGTARALSTRRVLIVHEFLKGAL